MGHTKITLEQGDKMMTAEMPEEDLDFMDFMDMIRSMILSTDYQPEEINEYILTWAATIKASYEN